MKKSYKRRVVLIFLAMTAVMNGCGNRKGAEQTEAEITEASTSNVIVVETAEGARPAEQTTAETTSAEPKEEEEVSLNAEDALKLAKKCHEAELKNDKDVLLKDTNLKELIRIASGGEPTEEDLETLFEGNDKSQTYPALEVTKYGEPTLCTREEISKMNELVQALYSSSDNKNSYEITQAYKIPVEYENDNAETGNGSIAECYSTIYVLEANGEWKYDMWVGLISLITDVSTDYKSNN